MSSLASIASADYEFDWTVVSDNMDVLLRALGLTIWISIVAEVLALVIGLVAALMRVQKVRPLRWLSAGFIDIFRAIPLLVLLIWLYYGLTIVLGIELSAFQAGVLGLALLYGAFLAEVFRSGLEAVPVGQREAALTLGFTRWQTGRYIVIPQAIRVVIPALANSYVGVLKDATLVSLLGLNEMMRTAQNLVSSTFRPFEIYTFVAFVYLVLVLLFSWLVRILERRVPIR